MRKETKAELLDLAEWIQIEFKLALLPKVREAGPAEKIHAEIVRRLGESR